MPYENNFPQEEGPLHEDPEKNLRIENEILQMKLRAEFGGFCAGSSNLPPELENEFLKSVLEFERRYKDVQFIPLAELIGNPQLKRAEELSDQAIVMELERLRTLLKSKHIVVSFLRRRDARFQYRFITEELLHHDTENIVMPGLIKYFVYEEFHPDHELTIRDRTMNILASWFEQCPEMIEIYLANSFIQPDGTIFTRGEQVNRMKEWMSSFLRFEDCGYNIGRISFVLKDDEPPVTAMGHSEGRIKYTAVKQDGSREEVEGPFKIYFSCEGNWWSSFFFYMPGFNV
jgi:hypothetical protein